MQRIILQTEGLSVCLSLTTVSPAKTAEQIEMPFGMWIRMDPRNWVLDEGPDPYGKDIFEGMTSGFSARRWALSSGHGIESSPHAIDQRSNWPPAETVACHIKFPNDTRAMRPLIKIRWPLVLNSLHWLKINEGIEYKLLPFALKIIIDKKYVPPKIKKR